MNRLRDTSKVPLVPRPRDSVQGTLALDLVPVTAPPDVRGLPARAGADVVLVNPRTATDVQRWSLAFFQAVVEAICGDRPTSQLVRWCTSDIHAEITYRAAAVARAGAHRAGQGRVRATSLRPNVASVRTCFLTSATVEVCAVVRHGKRSRFLAARIERWDERWCCTALEFG
ncbi:Rv3235 family protein [Nocardioides alcanivorans]|uniref:Rv3235 family protein n=1 Tax=Nocardioides alcanivorans TaxID=2897352 RepID=UPI001F26CB13|nr:Rv3235 family protein [Nocardioides alcanivorans]